MDIISHNGKIFVSYSENMFNGSRPGSQLHKSNHIIFNNIFVPYLLFNLIIIMEEG